MTASRLLISAALYFCYSVASPLHAEVAAPRPYGPVPSERQLRWHELGQYAFVHFGIDTFTDKEWGFGDEDPALFKPTAFDAAQIAAVAKNSGMAGLIFTAKHHDGLCLWPTKSTPHHIGRTSYQNGRGDMVREMADACKAAGLKFGLYVSPWDRNHPDYGQAGYVKAYHQQIDELSSNYGPLFEMWFDGASGGTGYYGGKGGRRDVDYNTYYGWKEIRAIIRKNQPGCAIWCGQYDEGGRTHWADCRWGGSEAGIVNDPCWNAMSSAKVKTIPWGTGHRQGDTWCPAEGDTSVRHGWFWHASQNGSVKPPRKLMDIYLACVGRGANLILNIPPDTRGRVHENDVDSLAHYGKHLHDTFAVNLAADASAESNKIRGGDAATYGPAKLLDADPWSAWVTDDADTTAEVVVNLMGEKSFNLIRLREDIRLGQRIEGVALDAWVDGAWKELAKAQSIGACRLWRIPKTRADKLRLRVTRSAACPALSDFGLFLEPEFAKWVPPVGGKKPTPAPGPATQPKWRIVSASNGNASAAVDGNPHTLWATHDKVEHPLPQEFVADLGKAASLTGFTYLPRQDHTLHGMVDRYRFQVSSDGREWKTVSAGEFGNLRANPIEQSISFVPVTARYFKFIAEHALEMNHAAVAEIGIIEAR